MQDRIDPLIEERAPWVFRTGPGHALCRAALMKLLGYPRTVALADTMADMPCRAIMDTMAELLAHDVDITGLKHVPARGPALVVSNHPTGIADGIMLYHALRDRRPDHYFFANHDILRVLPQLEEMIAPVEWRADRRTVAKTRATMAYVHRAVQAGRLGVIFPSGRLAKRRGLRLCERPWMASAAMIARRLDLPVIPINIRARNSALFYLFDLVHPTLRDITLFHETLNKARQPFRITIGAPVPARDLPARSEDGIALLRDRTLALGGGSAPDVSLVDNTRRPAWLGPRRAPRRLA
ncbi:1-acyl-sn-glycerol-3-phosphate acyltransferase [Pseudaestuariivita atlantica]|uniref:Glycerol acyltransferase n=1 Tax=Pseudaestuariivita atlantica TaxID=1317121 RepID=A0A0L1JTS8_9RHOB|nr:1-acyl-sn-glycerol-3-phosphate acyltransferase [Pseudaestuariivita atlantica]KNG95092.1 glycerol acyltransferase [Pseudaestuariivita atlantica]